MRRVFHFPLLVSRAGYSMQVSLAKHVPRKECKLFQKKRRVPKLLTVVEGEIDMIDETFLGFPKKGEDTRLSNGSALKYSGPEMDQVLRSQEMNTRTNRWFRAFSARFWGYLDHVHPCSIIQHRCAIHFQKSSEIDPPTAFFFSKFFCA